MDALQRTLLGAVAAAVVDQAVSRDRVDPGPCRAAPEIEPRSTAESALEGVRDDVLGERPVVRPVRHVREQRSGVLLPEAREVGLTGPRQGCARSFVIPVQRASGCGMNEDLEPIEEM